MLTVMTAARPRPDPRSAARSRREVTDRAAGDRSNQASQQKQAERIVDQSLAAADGRAQVCLEGIRRIIAIRSALSYKDSLDERSSQPAMRGDTGEGRSDRP